LKQKGAGGSAEDGERDPMFEDAARIVFHNKGASTSMLQRRLRLGYGRAARIIDELERAGIVGPGDGSKPREILIDSEDELELVLQS
jgi:S-DNA-T family DNA segregation ATPase FtsK/SpoIIIE